jgi:hypothetical protein
MTTSRFLIVGVAGLVAGAIGLALAAVIHSPALAVVGVAALLAAGAAKTAWSWRGAGREGLMWAGWVGLVIAVALIVSALSS